MFKAEIKDSIHPGKTCFVLGGINFEVDEGYVISKGLGYGSHGIMCLAQHTASEERLAIEKIDVTFDNLEETSYLAKELVLLSQLRHGNVVSLKGIMTPTRGDYSDLYVVYGLMAQDLREKAKSARLSIRHAQLFTYQLLCALHYLHSAGVTHADLRPKHLLIDNECDVKVVNFTSSFTSASHAAATVQRLDQPLWYCAPELLASAEIGTSIDIWSAGCILGELLTKRPLFKGSTAAAVLTRICNPAEPSNPRNIPPAEIKDACQQLEAVRGSSSQPNYQAMVSSKCPDCPPPALDLLASLLRVDPAARASAAQALQSPWFSGIREPELEAAASSAASLPPPSSLTSPAALRALFRQLAKSCTAV